MSKSNNLSDFVSDIADTIRLKKCDASLINPQDISDVIWSLGNKAYKEVNYFDLNGIILESYTLEEFQNITDVPTPTVPEGLIFTGWTHSIEDVKSGGKGVFNIGPLYEFVDASYNAIFVISVPSDEFKIELKGFEGNVDWGDGEVSSSYTHYYNTGIYYIKGNISSSPSYNVNKYPITPFQCLKMCFLQNSYQSFFLYQKNKVLTYICNSIASKTFDNFNVDYQTITKLNAYSMYNSNLKNYTLSQSITSIPDYAFKNTTIEDIIIPSHINSIGTQAFARYGSSKCSRIIINDSSTTLKLYDGSLPQADFVYLGRNVQSNTSSTNKIFAKSIVIGDMVSSLPKSFLRGSEIGELYIPETITSFGEGIAQNALNLKTVTFNAKGIIPVSFCDSSVVEYVKVGPQVTGLNSCFRNCSYLKVVDFSEVSVVVTHYNGESFRNTPDSCVFIVPDSLYDEWIVASEWNKRVSQIVKVSEYTE